MTKNQRRDLYYAAMFEIVAFGLFDCGICWALLYADEQDTWDGHRMSALPELQSQKPKEPYNEAYWFRPGRSVSERLLCLSKAIDLCEKR